MIAAVNTSSNDDGNNVQTRMTNRARTSTRAVGEPASSFLKTLFRALIVSLSLLGIRSISKFDTRSFKNRLVYKREDLAG